MPGKVTLTPDPAANVLVIEDPFAFLLAVIFDQGIPAERGVARPRPSRRIRRAAPQAAAAR